MVLQAIKYRRGELEILDQLKLPHQEIYVRISTPEQAWDAIKTMKVRGAPAIAIVAILSIAVWAANVTTENTNTIPQLQELIPQCISDYLKFLVTSRPTAVNLAEAATRFDNLVWSTWKQFDHNSLRVIDVYIEAAEQMLVDDVNDNERIGNFGADWILQKAKRNNQEKKASVLTHCNTGSLATAGYGTALGVIRSLHTKGSLDHVFYTETRPYNQGARLTGYELIHDKIPATLVTDSMAASLLCSKGRPNNIAAIIVGADRVASNGDTANKIGTYSLAIIARYHNVKFLVAAPRTTIDLNTKSGSDIIIEQRPPAEVTSIKGPIAVAAYSDGASNDLKDHTAVIDIAAKGTEAWNPAFDVTPAELIDAIVTEVGVVEKNDNGLFDMAAIFN